MVLPETRTLHLYTGICETIPILYFIIITKTTTNHTRARCYLFCVNRSRFQTPSPPIGMHAETHRGQNTVWAYQQNRTARRLIDDWGAAVRPARPSPTPPIWCRVYPSPLSDLPRSNIWQPLSAPRSVRLKIVIACHDFYFTNLPFF